MRRAIDELGYVRNESARQLRAGRSRAIAYVVLDASNPFFTDVARGAQDVAQAAGLILHLVNSNEDAQLEDTTLELLLEQRVRGVLITPVDPHNPRLDRLPERGVPLVLVDRGSDTNACSVSVDDVTGGRLAVTHLVETGHRRIAFVGGPASLPQVADRARGAHEALAAAKLPADGLVLLETEALNVAEGRRAGQRLARAPRVDAARPPPSAPTTCSPSGSSRR